MGAFLFLIFSSHSLGYIVLMCYLCKIIFCFLAYCAENGNKIKKL